MNTQRAITIAALTLAALAGCSRDDEPASAPSTEAPMPPSDRIQVPQTVRETLGLTFATVAPRHVAETVRLPGRFEFEPGARHEARVPLGGRVELAVKQLQRVSAGDLLFRVDAPGWRDLQREIETEWSAVRLAETRLAAAKRRLELARMFERLNESDGPEGAETHLRSLRATVELWKERHAALEQINREGGGRAAELAAALSAWRTAQAELADTLEDHTKMLVGLELDVSRAVAELDVARRRYHVTMARVTSILGDERARGTIHAGPARWLAIATLEVRAPADGVVETIDAASGQWVDDGGLVLRVVDPARVRFRAVALQADIEQLTGLSRGTLLPPTARATSDGVPCSVRLGIEADPDHRTIALLATPDGTAPWVRAGVATVLELTVDGTAAPELAIPTECVARDGVERVLFRRNPRNPDEVIRVEADLGPSDGRWVVVRSGLRAGDEVVRDGVYELKLSGAGKAVGGHFHADGTFHAGDH